MMYYLSVCGEIPGMGWDGMGQAYCWRAGLEREEDQLICLEER